ncbi:MAG: ATP-binding protein, partial [Akkermansiaceae bacterium]|nr:ATP-binding protein [Akkermansiaceae bacterium]
MEIAVADYEKLGRFYLGREYDVKKGELEEGLVLYDSKDLVTHGVVLGMTGSGKTGLCLALLEEAAMDNIPAIVIDPKGDIANLMLTFPEFRPEDFRPWINEDDARKKNISPDEFAGKTAAMWKNGIADWGQSPDRVRRFQDKVDINIFTPGSKAGIPVSILSSLGVPPFEVMDDGELLGERIESTVSSLLSLVGVDADPIQSPEAVLLGAIFNHCWAAEQGLTLESLIRHIQRPPFGKVGVIDLESFMSSKDRQELALRFNNLLASPGFSTWLQGPPLDIQRMMFADDGKPRISIFSIAHLGDTERMFFVSLLLNQMLAWMRSQSGTTSLRAMLYMDEIYGFLPPTANPPSKKPLMTILKQGRAFGLGTLLATQNPVDLDYKALSNIGTWFLGRLQTERDKERVMDGLTSAEGGMSRKEISKILSGVEKRVFL